MASRTITPDTNGMISVGGLFEIPFQALTTAATGEPTRKGLKVCDDRIDVVLPHGDGIATYSIAVQIIREAKTDQELARVAVYAAGVDGRKAKRDADEAKHRQNEKLEYAKLARESALEGLNSVARIAPAMDALKTLGLIK